MKNNEKKDRAWMIAGIVTCAVMMGFALFEGDWSEAVAWVFVIVWMLLVMETRRTLRLVAKMNAPKPESEP